MVPLPSPLARALHTHHNWPGGHTTGQSSQQMPRLSTGLDSKDHAFSTERFSGSPLIMVIIEGQLVHEVRLSGPFLRRQRLPPPIKYELAGTGQLGGKQRETLPCTRRPNGSTRESGTESRGAHPRYAMGPSTRAGGPGVRWRRERRPSRCGGQEFRAREGEMESVLIRKSSGAGSICLITALNASAQHTMRAH